MVGIDHGAMAATLSFFFKLYTFLIFVVIRKTVESSLLMVEQKTNELGTIVLHDASTNDK